MERTDTKMAWRLGKGMSILYMGPQIFPIPGTASLDTRPRKFLAYFPLNACSKPTGCHIVMSLTFDLLCHSPPLTTNKLAMSLTHFWNPRQTSAGQEGLDSQQGMNTATWNKTELSCKPADPQIASFPP